MPTARSCPREPIEPAPSVACSVPTSLSGKFVCKAAVTPAPTFGCGVSSSSSSSSSCPSAGKRTMADSRARCPAASVVCARRRRSSGATDDGSDCSCAARAPSTGKAARMSAAPVSASSRRGCARGFGARRKVFRVAWYRRESSPVTALRSMFRAVVSFMSPSASTQPHTSKRGWEYLWSAAMRSHGNGQWLRRAMVSALACAWTSPANRAS